MSSSVRQLFHELADAAPKDRERILARSEVTPQVRSEVLALLEHDSTAGDLDRCIADVAGDAFGAIQQLSTLCGPYRLVQLLGTGGMGAVYLAERADGEIEQKVAIKLLRTDADDEARRDRFLRERQLLAYLNHPAIARLLDAGRTADGRPYLVMEHVDGVTIDEYAAMLDLREKLALFLQVCDGVSHAHRRLIIHRDLKPSNILVDATGAPKLLDFGIAKLLDVTADQTADQTRTVERLLTPNYASPEQLRGEVQTTATDIYSLGAVLHRLLTGQLPRDTQSTSNSLPRDLHYILRKSVREEPDERYSSVDAFASDIRAFLEHRPVHARAGAAWYYTHRFLRRYWAPAAAAVITISGLAVGMSVANRERAIAQHRFQQVRQLANKVLALDTIVSTLPGSTKARHEIVSMSKEYLESLAPSAREDSGLALEVAKAYVRLAGVQGVPGPQNLGFMAQAQESLLKAEAMVQPILSASPHDREALLVMCKVNQGLMALNGQGKGSKAEIMARAKKTVQSLDALRELGPLSPAEGRDGAKLLYSIALTYRNLHLHDEALRYSRRSAELARATPDGHENLAEALSLMADLTRIAGDLEGALAAIHEARATVEKATFSSVRRRCDSWFKVLWREGVILGGAQTVSLNRPTEAVAVLEQAWNVIEEWADSDPGDIAARILFDQAARELGGTLREHDPARALEVYDRAIRRLREVKDNVRARRGEAGMLAGSSYALRRLNRPDEARQRIDAALEVLRATKDYPADHFDTDSEVEPTLRALGDHLAETGQPVHAAQVYQELLDKLLAAHPDPANDLRQCNKLSRIYGALAVLHRRNGRNADAEAMNSIRRSLWREWRHKLPNNAYVRRQAQAAGV